MTTNRNELWTEFFKKEAAYLEWLEDNSTCLFHFGLETIRYVEINMGTGSLPKHQTYLRHIRLADDFGQAINKSQPMIKAFENAVLNDKPNSHICYPGRFPTFLQGCNRITVFKKDAWSSFSVKDRAKPSLINTYFLTDNPSDVVAQAMADIACLHDNGMTSAALHEVLGELRLTVNESDILSYYGSEAIQKRLPTGNNYNARVTFDYNHVETYSLNLLVLDSSVSIYRPNPRKKRSDAYRIEDSLTFPIATPFYFFEAKRKPVN
ncbi:hypothetical protein G6Z92_06580 [Vibrio aestuarianus subsp. cardii]|uniref:hypothetical protein n=1 Tax=Vibrio aestuarianus TaxID=28171 RepID=UPI0015C54555|nr:hypothetical protein [Vibrio aestuarianus]NGZ66651.1 hypothetical protein [Vibrio aestuarianus subsp. cardii]